LEERVRELVSVVEQEKTQRLEAEARLKILHEDNVRQKESSTMHHVACSQEGKEASANAIDLQATVGQQMARPTLFDIANMD
jgi:hypothetical protein